jgi:hypothetical protein
LRGPVRPKNHTNVGQLLTYKSKHNSLNNEMGGNKTFLSDLSGM